ncbi:MAG: EI24 domain-containing protein [Burkholderiales bacterium]|nr:MAG: EI24 domain-containing protein [Burkholderiales bacterium]
MLALLVVPFLAAVLLWLLTAWLFWDPVLAWLHAALFEGDGWIASGLSWLTGSGLPALGETLPVLIALLVLVPLMVASGVVLVAVIAMPIVMRHLGARDYADVAASGSLGLGTSLWNGLTSIVLFALGYLLTLPLWLIPPLALVLPWLWWSWLTARVMRIDALLEHARPEEREALIAAHRGRFFVLALVVSALNFFPPFMLIAPVFSALAFGHFALQALRDSRRPAL